MVAPSVAAAGTYSAGTGDRSPGVPSGVVSGSFVMIWLGISNSASPSGPPSGFSTLIASAGTNGIWEYYKTASGADAGTYSVPGGGAQTGHAIAARIVDVNTSDPFFGSTSLGTQTTSTTTAAVSLTGVPANTLLVWMVRCNGGTPSVTPPTGFTLLDGVSTGRGTYVATKSHSGGDTGSLTGTLGASTSHRTALIALLPLNIDGASAPTVESVTLSGTGARGVDAAATTLSETVTLSGAGAMGYASGASVAAAVSLSGAGATGVFGAAAAIVSALFDPHESTINEAEGTETVQLDGGGATGASSGAVRTVTTGLTAAVEKNFTGFPTLTVAVGSSADLSLGLFEDSDLVATAGLTASGTAALNRAASGALGVVLAAAGEVTRTFHPPTQLQSVDDNFWGRYSIPVGISLLRSGDTFVRVPTPTHDELRAAGVEGTDWFRGGYVYEVTEAVWDELVAAGLT